MEARVEFTSSYQFYLHWYITTNKFGTNLETRVVHLSYNHMVTHSWNHLVNYSWNHVIKRLRNHAIHHQTWHVVHHSLNHAVSHFWSHVVTHVWNHMVHHYWNHVATHLWSHVLNQTFLESCFNTSSLMPVCNTYFPQPEALWPELASPKMESNLFLCLKRMQARPRIAIGILPRTHQGK
jgi:hypothetical protein